MIINDEMSLQEKLSAIEKAMAQAQEQAQEEALTNGTPFVPVDPQDLLMCESCQ